MRLTQAQTAVVCVLNVWLSQKSLTFFLTQMKRDFIAKGKKIVCQPYAAWRGHDKDKKTINEIRKHGQQQGETQQGTTREEDKGFQRTAGWEAQSPCGPARLEKLENEANDGARRSPLWLILDHRGEEAVLALAFGEANE